MAGGRLEATGQFAEGGHRLVTNEAAGFAPDSKSAINGGHEPFLACALIFRAHPLYRRWAFIS